MNRLSNKILTVDKNNKIQSKLILTVYEMIPIHDPFVREAEIYVST